MGRNGPPAVAQGRNEERNLRLKGRPLWPPKRRRPRGAPLLSTLLRIAPASFPVSAKGCTPNLLFLQRTGKKQGRLARGSLSGPQAANQKLHGSGAPFGPVPLKIQCGNNGFPLRGWRSHAASAGLDKLHASASLAQQKSRRGFPAGTHFASFNFANRSFRRFVSTAPHRGGICISSASCSLPSG
jgi:hypothetical protein